MKLKKLTVFLLLFCSISLQIHAQNQFGSPLPDVIPPSPQTAQFVRYGEIPVGHTTGVPQIDIPLYTLSTGKIDIPISVSYHASGFRVNDISSPVGLGWVLNAGGLIARSIEGNPDYQAGKEKLYNSPVKSMAAMDSVKTGRKLIYTPPMDMSGKDKVNFWETFFIGHTPVYDIRSDRYSYNFLDHNGIGRYDINDTAMRLKTLPYEPLEFTYLPDAEKYQVIDSKGILYEFAELENVTSGGMSLSTVTGWYLTKIIFPGLEMDPVTFTYQRAQSYTHYSYEQISRLVKHGDSPGTNTSGIIPNDLYTNNYISGISYRSPLIQKISWRGVNIVFTYSSDRVDFMKERLTNIEVTEGNSILKRIAFNQSYFGTTDKNKRLKLDSVRFPMSGEAYTFTYNMTKNSSLPEYYVNSDTGVHCMEDYWGYWNGTKSSYVFPVAVADKWRNTTSPYTIPSTDRSVNETYTKACVLEEIIYPAGGKTRFEYEINRAVSPFNYGGTSTKSDALGGLRLKRQTDYADNGTVAHEKEYEYPGAESLMRFNNSFEAYFHYTTLFVNGYSYFVDYTPGSAYFPYFITCFVSTPHTSLSNLSSSPVFYYKVKEYKGTSSNHNGWTIYDYLMSDRSSFGCYTDGPQMPQGLIETVDCDHGHMRGRLSSRTVYDTEGNIVFMSRNDYQTASRMFPTGVRITLGAETDGDWQAVMDWGNTLAYQDYFLANLITYSTFAYRDYELLTQTTDVWYENGSPVREDKKEYKYDYRGDGNPVLLTPYSVSHTNSTGKVHTQTTVFPYHAAYKNTFPFSLMCGKHMLEYPVEVKEHIGSDTLRNIRTLYGQISGNLILPRKIQISSGNGGVPKNRISYNSYDARGNLCEVVKDDLNRVVYLWSYNYRYPILKIEGATRQEVVNAISFTETQIGALAAETSPSISLIGQLKTTLENHLPDALVYSYTYKSGVGILTETDPRGFVTTYDYDSSGRLVTVFEDSGNGKKVKEYYKYNLGN